jgi:hypothetical protein
MGAPSSNLPSTALAAEGVGCLLQMLLVDVKGPQVLLHRLLQISCSSLFRVFAHCERVRGQAGNAMCTKLGTMTSWECHG